MMEINHLKPGEQDEEVLTDELDPGHHAAKLGLGRGVVGEEYHEGSNERTNLSVDLLSPLVILFLPESEKKSNKEPNFGRNSA